MARRIRVIQRVLGVALAIITVMPAGAYEPCENAVPLGRLTGHPTLPGPIVVEGERPAAIVFVHGFTGDGRNTWTNANGTYWPLLAGLDPDFAKFDTYAFEYESSWWGPCRRVSDIADSLHTFITDKGLLERYSRLVFVAHSQGGMVVRQYMIRYQAIIEGKVPFVFLYGTPSGGSTLANAAHLLSKCSQVQDLVALDDNAMLQIQLQDWRAAKSLQSISVHCAIEDLTILGTKIVERASGELGCTTVTTLSANHIELVKPACLDDERHAVLRNRIRELSRELGAAPAPAEPRERGSLPPRPDESAGDIAEVWAVVNKLKVHELVGQLFLVGVYGNTPAEAADAIEGLVRRNRVGNVLLHSDNFVQAPEDVSTAGAAAVAALADRLQQAAAEAHKDRRVPLTIAVNEGAASGDALGMFGTRFPCPMFLGAMRDASAVYYVAKAMGTELRLLGVNAVLGPTADINTCVTSDVVGRRSFGAHKDIVTPLSFAFMRGLQDGGVVSVVKHFPGSGSAEGDANYAVSRTGYADLNELESKDLLPFDILMGEGVDGIMTSHVTVPAINMKPVTFSPEAVTSIIRGRLGYFRVVFTDDLSLSVGILKDADGRVRTRGELAIEALEAGHDVLTFARLSADGTALPQRWSSAAQGQQTMTITEFEGVVKEVIQYFAASNRLRSLRERVARVLTAKRAVFGDAFTDPEAWMSAFNPATYQARVGEHAALAGRVAENSVVLITTNGAVANDTTPTRQFCAEDEVFEPLLQKDRKVLLVEPAKFPESALLRELQRHSEAQITWIPLINGWSDDERDKARVIWGRSIPVNGTTNALGQFRSDPVAIRARVDEITRAAAAASVVIFGVVTPDQAEILVRTAERLRDTKLVVLLYREPYLLPAHLYLQANVTVFSLSALDPKLSASLLLGKLRPRPASYLSLTIPGVVRREIELGVPVQNFEALRTTVGTSTAGLISGN
jgi:beta-N-acetylhexosaminidase